MMNSRLVIKVYNEAGKSVLTKAIHATSLVRRKSLVNSIVTSSGFASLKLNLNEAGTYTVLVSYETPVGTVTQQIQYNISSSIVVIPYTLLIVGLTLIIVLTLLAMTMLKRRR